MTAIDTFSNVQRAAEEPEYLEATDLLGDSGFSAAFPSPTVLKVGGKSYTLSCLTTEDYANWCRQETDSLRQRRIASIPSNVTASERWKINSNIEETEITPDHFAALVFQLEWQKKICIKVLTNAGFTEAEAEALLAKRSARANEMFAVYFSGLFTIHQFRQVYQRMTADQQKPAMQTFAGPGGGRKANAPFPSDSSGDSGEKLTGLSPASESNVPQAATSAA